MRTRKISWRMTSCYYPSCNIKTKHSFSARHSIKLRAFVLSIAAEQYVTPTNSSAGVLLTDSSATAQRQTRTSSARIIS